MNRKIGTIGAATVLVTVILFAVCMLIPFNMGSYFVCMILPIGFIMMSAAFCNECSKDRMAAAYIGMATATIYNNITSGRTFKPGTRGEELIPEMNIVSDFIFTKARGSALTSEEFREFIKEHDIREFFIAGADAVTCVKSTCFNMRKENYIVHVLSDCIVSYDMRKIDEILAYYDSKGCTVERLSEVAGSAGN